DRSCSIYSSIETLGSATDLEEIKKYATVPAGIDATIDTLKTEVDALKSANIQGELKRARDRAGIVKTLRNAVDTLSAFDIAAYESRVTVRSQASQRRDEAGNKAFDGLKIAGLLGREWQQFIQAGEEYLRQHGNAQYPQQDDPCAYCQQPLTATAVE